MTEDVAFYVELAREAEGPVVELAVGNGRVAIPVARETGRKVIGIDLSPAMLAGRGSGPPRQASTSSCARGHARLELEEPAGLVYCPFRSLLHMPTWRDRRRVFERVAAPEPGGRFAWNAFVFDPLIAARRDGEGAASDSRHRERVEYDPTESRIDITAWVGDPGEGERALALVGQSLRVGGARRRRGARGRGALRRLRPGPFDEEPRVRVGRPEAGLSVYDWIARLYDPWSRTSWKTSSSTARRRARRARRWSSRGRHRPDSDPDRRRRIRVIGVDSSPGMLEGLPRDAELAGSRSSSTCASAS